MERNNCPVQLNVAGRLGNKSHFLPNKEISNYNITQYTHTHARAHVFSYRCVFIFRYNLSAMRKYTLL